MNRLNLIFVLFLAHIITYAQCNHTLFLYDNANNGWSGASIDVKVNGVVTLSNLTLASGNVVSYTFTAMHGDTIETDFSAGSNAYQNRYAIQNPNGAYILSDGNGDEVPSVSMKAYADCDAVPVFTTNGDSYQSDEQCFILTEDLPGKSGSVWYNYKVDLSEDFEIDFTAFLGDKEVTLENSGADGITFALQGNCSASGGTGQSLGYGGISPSIAVEFDSYRNSSENDPVEDHIALVSNGSVNHNVSTNLAGPIHISAGFEDSVWHDVNIKWESASHLIEVSFDGNVVISYTEDIVNTIFGGNSIVFWGFTGGTGALYNRQEVCIPVLPVSSTALTDVSCEYCTEQVFIAQGANSYTWTPDDGSISDPTIYNPVFTPLVTTEYSVVIEDACGNFITDKFTINITLPIELLSFKLSQEQGKVVLNWETSSEINNDYFKIQKSLDGVNFKDIAKVRGAGNSNAIIKYKWIESEKYTSQLYYRLKQVDYNGNFSFSKVILFDPKVVENGVILFDTKMKTIRLVGFDVDFIYFCICNALGQELFKGYLKSNEKEVNLNFLDQGIYIFSVYGRFIEKQSKKIIIE